jgi:hypothetical protein
MNEKTKKFLTDARNKAEDAIVKAKAFIEKHPVACTIGGIAASSVVAGVIGKKVGYSNGFDVGYDEGQKEIENTTSMVYWNDDGTEFTIKDPSGEEVTFIKDLMDE